MLQRNRLNSSYSSQSSTLTNVSNFPFSEQFCGMSVNIILTYARIQSKKKIHKQVLTSGNLMSGPCILLLDQFLFCCCNNTPWPKATSGRKGLFWLWSQRDEIDNSRRGTAAGSRQIHFHSHHVVGDTGNGGYRKWEWVQEVWGTGSGGDAGNGVRLRLLKPVLSDTLSSARLLFLKFLRQTQTIPPTEDQAFKYMS